MISVFKKFIFVIFFVIKKWCWGSNKTSTLSNKKWFMTFPDDHTRLCWVLLLEKSNASQILKMEQIGGEAELPNYH